MCVYTCHVCVGEVENVPFLVSVPREEGNFSGVLLFPDIVVCGLRSSLGNYGWPSGILADKRLQGTWNVDFKPVFPPKMMPP